MTSNVAKSYHIVDGFGERRNLLATLQGLCYIRASLVEIGSRLG
jgi:hypothetical protein